MYHRCSGYRRSESQPLQSTRTRRRHGHRCEARRGLARREQHRRLSVAPRARAGLEALEAANFGVERQYAVGEKHTRVL